MGGSEYEEESTEWVDRWKNAYSNDELRKNARDHLLARIDALEAQVSQLQLPADQIGHNRPPEPIDDLPVTRQDVADLMAAIAAIRSEAGRPDPRIGELNQASEGLHAFTRKVVAWGGARGTKFADAAMDAGGKVAGGALFLAIAGLLPTISEVAAAVELLVKVLGP